MRSKNTGSIPNISRIFSDKESLEMFKRMCQIRYFELNVKKAYDSGKMPRAPIYLGLGQESITSALATIFTNRPALFGQHRGHDIYLSFGGDPLKLIDELLGRPTGCAGGMGGSASIHSPEINMVGHDGLMGTQVADSVGSSLADNEPSIAFMGDASAEEGFVLGPLGFAVTKKLPILFVVADNNLSILTEKKIRRNWEMFKHANFGMTAIEITDDPWLIMYHARRLPRHLPAMLNIYACRDIWHAGTGNDGEPEWNRFQLVREELERIGLKDKAETIEKSAQEYMDQIWDLKLNEPQPKIITGKKSFTIIDPNYKYERSPIIPAKKIKLKEAIREVTRHILKYRGGKAMGQCLTAVGYVGETVPEMIEEEGLIELSMDDSGGSGIAVGCSRKVPTVYIVRYQGFQWFNAAFIANLGAKSKEMWGTPRRLLVRSVAMEGGIGPVASNSHHGIFTRMPGITVVAPMTPGEYFQIADYFNSHDDPMYVSEHRRSFDIDYEMDDDVYLHGADITLLPISAARLNAIEAAEILREKYGILCNIVHLLWLKPFQISDKIKTALASSKFGGLVIDTDFEDGFSKCIAHDLMHATDKKVNILGLEERTAGFPAHFDNLPPSSEKICEKVIKIIRNRN